DQSFNAAASALVARPRAGGIAYCICEQTRHWEVVAAGAAAGDPEESRRLRVGDAGERKNGCHGGCGKKLLHNLGSLPRLLLLHRMINDRLPSGNLRASEGAEKDG